MGKTIIMQSHYRNIAAVVIGRRRNVTTIVRAARVKHLVYDVSG